MNLEERTLVDLVIIFALSLTRVSSFVISSPMLGERSMPNTVKVAFCVAVGIFVFPGIEREFGTGASALDWRTSLVILGREFIVGFTIGYLVRLVMLPARIAGSYMGQEFGFSLGQVADPSTGVASNEVRLLTDALALVLFWMTDSHHVALRVLANQKIGDHLIEFPFTEVLGHTVSYVHQVALQQIGPMVLALLLILVCLCVVMRSWSQMTLFLFGSGVRVLFGIGAFFVFVPWIVLQISSWYRAMPDTLARILFFD